MPDPTLGPASCASTMLYVPTPAPAALQVSSMQSMLEETLTKNLHLQQNLESMSQVTLSGFIWFELFCFGFVLVDFYLLRYIYNIIDRVWFRHKILRIGPKGL